MRVFVIMTTVDGIKFEKNSYSCIVLHEHFFRRWDMNTIVDTGIRIGNIFAAENDFEKAREVVAMMLRMKEVWEAEAKAAHTSVSCANWWGLETVLAHAMKVADPRLRAMLFRHRRARRWLAPEDRFHFRYDLRVWIPPKGRVVLADFFTRLAEIDEVRARETG